MNSDIRGFFFPQFIYIFNNCSKQRKFPIKLPLCTLLSLGKIIIAQSIDNKPKRVSQEIIFIQLFSITKIINSANLSTKSKTKSSIYLFFKDSALVIWNKMKPLNSKPNIFLHLIKIFYPLFVIKFLCLMPFFNIHINHKYIIYREGI